MPKSSNVGGKVKKENCAFLTRTSQQGERAGQGWVEVGPELLMAAPAQVIRKWGLDLSYSCTALGSQGADVTVG